MTPTNELLITILAACLFICAVNLHLSRQYKKEDEPIIEDHEKHFSVDENGELIEPKYFKRFL